MSTATMTSKTAPEFRAAGTDLSERRRSGVSKGPLVDIAAGGDASITWAADGAATIGAFATIATIAADTRIKDVYRGLSASAQGLATPQIRHLATLGGNLAQRSRCWYFRKPHIDCLKKGGSNCPARLGNHLYGEPRYRRADGRVQPSRMRSCWARLCRAARSLPLRGAAAVGSS
jgi:xanthine dehydrogenase YagS FAD-binding subunit